MFSKACEYAIKATIYIAAKSNKDKYVSLKDIAKEIKSPEAFTAKILQELSKNNIITSVKGRNGGFSIDKKMTSKIKLSQIVSAIDGDRIYKGCGLGLKVCSEKFPCPAHEKFVSIRNELKNMLENTSVKELSLGIKTGFTFLKR